MTNSNFTSRMVRSMSEINPYMSGKVHPMPEPKARHWQDAVIYAIAVVVFVGLAIAGQS